MFSSTPSSPRARTLARRLSPIAIAALGVGCGLISSDITSIKFMMPQRSYSVDVASLGNFPAIATVPSIPCTDTAVCCASATTLGVPCANVTCDTATSTCALKAVIETQPQTVNLKMEVPALSSLNSQSLADVTVSQIKYDITTNTMNVDLPPVDLYVAPESYDPQTGTGAQKFGTVPMTARMSMPAGANVALDSAGQQAFAQYARNFGTPFVFFARTTVVAAGGTPVPSGRVDLTVTGQVTVKPSL